MRYKDTLSLSRLITVCIIILLTTGIIIFPQEVLEASKRGIQLWFNTLFPSLFPFMVATYLLIELGVVHFIGILFEPVMGPIFNVPGEGAFPWMMGIISGYPIGAKITADLRCKGKISQVEAQRLIAFTNNSGPLFILGAVSAGMLSKAETGFFLLAIHYLSSLTVGLLFRFYKKGKKVHGKKYKNIIKKSFQQLSLIQKNNSKKIGLILKESIMSSMDTVVQIGGFVILFSVTSQLLELSSLLDLFTKLFKPFFKLIVFSPKLISAFLLGIIEITNGISRIGLCSASLKEELALVSFLIAFGGLSVFMQTVSVISSSDINIPIYACAKLLQGLFAFIYSVTFYPQMTKISAYTQTVFNPISYNITNSFWFKSGPYLCAFICILFILFNIKLFRTKEN